MAQNVEVGLTSLAEKKKKRYVRAISDVSGSIAGRYWPHRNFRLEYCILNLLGTTFSRKFIKAPFFTNSENKNRNFTVIFTVYFHWEISIIHRKAYKKATFIFQGNKGTGVISPPPWEGLNICKWRFHVTLYRLKYLDIQNFPGLYVFSFLKFNPSSSGLFHP